jgi:hypothetical protein
VGASAKPEQESQTKYGREIRVFHDLSLLSCFECHY